MSPEMLDNIVAEKTKAHNGATHEIRVCIAAGCGAANANAVKEAFKKKVEANGQHKSCHVKGVGCMGLCSKGPLVSVSKKGGEEHVYQHVKETHVDQIIASVDKKPVKELLCDTKVPFFTQQKKIVLENSGIIDPENIGEYIARDGYKGLVHILENLTPEQVVKEIITSGLRGRGGAGYPTGLKWSTVAKAATQTTKYVICNADEGDPGAFMDRAVLESDPHRVLEGMLIAAYAIGASKGYVYIRGEYPLAIKHLKTAIKDAQSQGLLGHRVAGSQFEFDVDIRIGAGAFVCGEETALIASVQGNRGNPRPRPPYPAEYGLWGCPTLINNVETFANIPTIMRKGGEWFAGIGTEKSKGTKVFALAGRVVNTGIVEVPMGTTLREIIFDIGGGVSDGGVCKAVQTGGPSGGCIPASQFDTPVDYESLRALGSIMGSGGMIVMDHRTSMVEIARFFMEFCMTESCGKCVPCRAGTVQMHELLDRFVKKQATAKDLVVLQDLCEVVQNTSLCGLGQSAPNPILSTIRYFKQEYEACMIGKG